MTFVRKINKIPEYYMIFPKNYQNTQIFMRFVPKFNTIREFYTIFPEKLTKFSNFYDSCPQN